jgi:hypothetical protein
MNEVGIERLEFFMEDQVRVFRDGITETIQCREKDLWPPGMVNLVLSRVLWPGYAQARWWLHAKGPALLSYLKAPAGAKKKDTQMKGSWKPVYDKVLSEADQWLKKHPTFADDELHNWPDWPEFFLTELSLLETATAITEPTTKRERYTSVLIMKTIAGHRRRMEDLL